MFTLQLLLAKPNYSNIAVSLVVLLYKSGRVRGYIKAGVRWSSTLLPTFQEYIVTGSLSYSCIHLLFCLANNTTFACGWGRSLVCACVRYDSSQSYPLPRHLCTEGVEHRVTLFAERPLPAAGLALLHRLKPVFGVSDSQPGSRLYCIRRFATPVRLSRVQRETSSLVLLPLS